MDDDMKQKIAQVQVDNNFPGLEKLVKLVDAKYPEITRSDVKNFLMNDVISQQTKTQNKPKKAKEGHITACRMSYGMLIYL